MSHAARARNHLGQIFVDGLATKLAVIQDALSEGTPTSGESIRRIAHQLRGTASLFGHPGLASLSRRVEDAEADSLWTLATRLVSMMRSAIGGAHKNKVLFVECSTSDGPLPAALAKAGYDIIRATTAADAEHLLQTHDIAVVMLVLRIGDNDGRTLLARLGEAIVDQRLPLVTVVEDDDLKAHELIALGADQVLRAPVEHATVTATVAHEIERSVAQQEGDRDALTGLVTRRVAREMFGRLKALSERTHMLLAVAILDLDHFKDVNDSFGHAAGDSVLRRLAMLLEEHLRDTDVVTRWGGEEFVVIFPNAAPRSCREALERVKTILSRETLTDERAPTRVTFSGGVVEVGEGESLDEAVARADALLYAAKDAGRNLILDRMPGDNERHKPRILYAEDDASLAATVVELLIADGYDVAHCADGAAALEAARGSRFELIILDAMMPQVSGFEVVDALRTGLTRDQVPIVMMTALDGDSDVERAFDGGVDDYLQKPVRPRQLRARVRRILTRSTGRMARPTRRPVS